ncbi:MAG: primosomal protein N' [Gammaproteobacteria bacterium]
MRPSPENVIPVVAPAIAPAAARSGTILRVALPVPLRKVFDYLPAPNADGGRLQPGVRLRVPFGRGTRVGVLLGTEEHSDQPAETLRRVIEVLDAQPLLDGEVLALTLWASRYYQAPIGEAVSSCLPTLLRRGHRPAARPAEPERWGIAPGRTQAEHARRAPRQAALLAYLAQHPAGVSGAALRTALGPTMPATLRTLSNRGQVLPIPAVTPTRGDTAAGPSLNPAQQQALAALEQGLDRFQVFVLEGVTGSGKTEVYLHLVDAVLKRGQQALFLVPEIGLTTQTMQRFEQRFPEPLAVLHSGLADGERLHNWSLAAAGQAAIVIGTRSAVWTPMPRLGVIVIDEEHDLSYKQQDGFRYSARDVALKRAQQMQIPIVLGSATPSLESLQQAAGGRYRQLLLPARAGGAVPPSVEVVDLRAVPLRGGLAPTVLARIAEHLGRGAQVLVFVNRRGYAPILLCHQCAWSAQCEHCDARLCYHKETDRLTCHHCARERAPLTRCPGCGGELLKVGYATERIVEVLQAHFPQCRTLRIDRDSTRRKEAWHELLALIGSGQADILVGTQMLSKGHHFPQVTLVVIVDADSGLYGVDFRAAERLAQQLLQVAGRAGRAAEPGQVMIQTHYPNHPLLQTLLRGGYPAFARAALAERRAASYPPCGYLVLLRVEALDGAQAKHWLTRARSALPRRSADGLHVHGPVPAPMERRAGRHRWQLLLQSPQRKPLQAALGAWMPALEALPTGRRLRWSLDVDPQELS